MLLRRLVQSPLGALKALKRHWKGVLHAESARSARLACTRSWRPREAHGRELRLPLVRPRFAVMRSIWTASTCETRSDLHVLLLCAQVKRHSSSFMTSSRGQRHSMPRKRGSEPTTVTQNARLMVALGILLAVIVGLGAFARHMLRAFRRSTGALGEHVVIPPPCTDYEASGLRMSEIGFLHALLAVLHRPTAAYMSIPGWLKQLRAHVYATLSAAFPSALRCSSFLLALEIKRPKCPRPSPERASSFGLSRSNKRTRRCSGFPDQAY